MKVNFKTRDHQMFFPGFRVKKMKNVHEKTYVVGSIFEELTATMLGGSRAIIDNQFDCCPDVHLDFTLIECKASARTCFVVGANQLKNYYEVWKEHIHSVWFALWRYKAVPGLMDTNVFTTKVVSRIQDLWLIDFPLVERLVKLAPVMYYIRGQKERIGYYRVGVKSLKGLFADPTSFAGKAFKVTQKMTTARFVLDGVEHTTPKFTFVSVLDRIPF